ncbi:MAG: DNA polymerase/3'-5' exonuclease PolX [Elusimicrobiales bacterium]|jgi:DNA polymerase (family 10)
MPNSISNSSIAALLYEAAELLELSGGNVFRVRAYQKAAQIVEGLTGPAAAMSGSELQEVKGIGKGIAAHIAAISASGVFPELEELRAKVPHGLLEILKVQGIGAKRARLLYEELGVDSLEKLKAAAAKGEIEHIAGLGPKVQANILAGVERAAGAPERMLYWEALRLAEDLIKELTALGFERVTYAGSLRRGRETAGDIDLLAAGRPDGAATEKFTRLAQVSKILAAGPAKASVLLKSGIQCDLRIVPPEVYGSALNYFTGSREHNVMLRELALKKGMSLSEYGLCRLSDKEHKRSVASRTEEEVYAALGLDYIPPELREGRDELELAAGRRLPKLLTLADIKGDAHNHTDLSDGTATMEEMLEAASAMGFDWYFAGDHSVPLGIARGLDPAAYRESRKKLFALSKRFPGLKLGRALEMEILKDGSLGFNAGAIKEVDFVTASVHSSMRLGLEEMTARVLKAMAEPCVDAVAHPSGRLIGRREPIALDYTRVFEAAARYGTAFEINGQPERQDLTDLTARMAKEAGVKILLSTDAHSAAQLAYMRSAVTVARRAGLSKEDVLNSLSYKEFTGWIAERRAKRMKEPAR